VKDTLGQPPLSFVRRLSSLRDSKCIGSMVGKIGASSCVLCREIVLISERSLLETSLYVELLLGCVGRNRPADVITCSKVQVLSGNTCMLPEAGEMTRGISKIFNCRRMYMLRI
jgi:hypothetical protein